MISLYCLREFHFISDREGCGHETFAHHLSLGCGLDTVHSHSDLSDGWIRQLHQQFGTNHRVLINVDQ